MLTFGSLFAGIGGIDLGLERAGMVCRFQVEIDPYCQKVLAKHWPNVPRYSDIREVSGDELEYVDLIAGGFPCQPVSLAGKRLAQEDERWLWPEFARILRELRPRYALMENVPGLLVRGMGDVLADLAALGYDAEWTVLSAALFGAPHIRERIFILAYTNGDEWSERWQQQPSVGAEKGSVSNASQVRRRWRRSVGEGQVLLETSGLGKEQRGVWTTQPRPFGVANGVPNRLHRLRGLGNAVVPQVAEWVGRRIIEADEALRAVGAVVE